MQLHYLAAQRQAEPDAALRAGARFVHAVERLRDVRDLLLRDAAAGIEHADAAAVGQHLGHDIDISAAVHGLARVIKQIH